MHIFRHFFEVKMHIFHEMKKKPESFVALAFLCMLQNGENWTLSTNGLITFACTITTWAC